MNNRRARLASAKRIVIKIGTGVLINSHNVIDLPLMEALTGEVARLCQAGSEVILVSSGAIAFGMLHLGLADRPKAIAQKQACAAIGQSRLVHHYEQLFAKSSIKVAQVLLSRGDLEDPQRYGNAKHTFEQLLDWKVLPIVNENDSVAVEELKIGDNDNLSAHVAVAVGAQLLIILSHVDGVFSADPRHVPDAKLLGDINAKELSRLDGITSSANSELNTGGMSTKIQAAAAASHAGISTAIINGRVANNLTRLLAGEEIGTVIYSS